LESLTNLYRKAEEPRLLGRDGKIFLVGAGPGSPSLLTLAAFTAIRQADLILSDKLVPEQVLSIIPKHIQVEIARKFPGNADTAQEELLHKGYNALVQGKNVVRLKQGDPYIFGRGGEELEFFRNSGFEPVVIPGISSALAAPLFASIPLTQRDISSQVVICTGTGKAGKPPALPAFSWDCTYVFLMSLHRLSSLVDSMSKAKWPSSVPCAIVERASCSDQQILYIPLEKVVETFALFDSQPPGLLVVGAAAGLPLDSANSVMKTEGLPQVWDLFARQVEDEWLR